MRREVKNYKEGDFRIRSKFAWRPVTINRGDSTFTVWLESYTITEKLVYHYTNDGHEFEQEWVEVLKEIGSNGEGDGWLF